MFREGVEVYHKLFGVGDVTKVEGDVVVVLFRFDDVHVEFDKDGNGIEEDMPKIILLSDYEKAYIEYYKKQGIDISF